MRVHHAAPNQGAGGLLVCFGFPFDSKPISRPRHPIAHAVSPVPPRPPRCPPHAALPLKRLDRLSEGAIFRQSLDPAIYVWAIVQMIYP